jgi:hypothetical protein
MSSYSEGQTHQLMNALEAADYTADNITELGQKSDRLANILGVLLGTHEIKLKIGHMVDLSSPSKLPFVEAKLEVHRGNGVVKLEKRNGGLYLNGKKIRLFRSEGQTNGQVVGGHDLRKELEARGSNVSAKVLDYLAEHPELWPESWKKDSQGNVVFVYFWDDIFRSPSNGSLYVRYGFWSGGRVLSGYFWLGHDWGGHYPAASLQD